MNRNAFVGLLCGISLVVATCAIARTQLESTVEKDVVNCRAQIAQAKVSGYVTNSLFPYCNGSGLPIPVAGHTFAATELGAKQGDQLTCKVVEHNAWYFSWDAPGWWFNDRSYSYEDCQVAKRA